MHFPKQPFSPKHRNFTGNGRAGGGGGGVVVVVVVVVVEQVPPLLSLLT